MNGTRLSPKDRYELVQIYFSAQHAAAVAPGLGSLTVSELCRQYGISRQTFYRWKRRFEQDGYAGLFDRPAGRPPLPRRTCLWEELVQRMICWRRWLGLSLRQIAEALRQFVVVSHVTVRSILQHRGVPGRVYKRKKKHWQRFERTKPDELWQLDHSQSDFDGQWRLTILDDHSRMIVCCQPVPSLTADWVCALLLQTIQRLGGRQPKQLLSDNGAAFRSQAVQQLLAVLGIQPVFTAVRHPQTLGKLERFHRTFQEQAWLFERPAAFLHYYNYERGHSALGGAAPAERYYQTEGFKRTTKLTSLGRTVTRFG